MKATHRRKTRKPLDVPARVPAAAAAARPVRLSRVRTALKRIQSGYYDRDDVRDRLAAAVLTELQKL
jgi:hypothetical protein